MEGASSRASFSVSSSDSECSTVSFCLLERWLANPAVLLSAATSEELLRSSSPSLKPKSRKSLCFRTAIELSILVECRLLLMKRFLKSNGRGVTGLQQASGV